MAAIIYAHGMPPAWSALIALAVQEKRVEFWRSYVADSVYMIGRMLAGREVMPMYSAMVDGKNAVNDRRSAEEIMEGLKQRFRRDVCGGND